MPCEILSNHMVVNKFLNQTVIVLNSSVLLICEI